MEGLSAIHKPRHAFQVGTSALVHAPYNETGELNTVYSCVVLNLILGASELCTLALGAKNPLYRNNFADRLLQS